MNKSGFGLLEVLLSAVVLGFLVLGLTKLQMGNREALLRIRTRDAAQIIAQDFLDSLSSLGISSIQGDAINGTRKYKWKSGKDESITTEIDYTLSGSITSKTVPESNYFDTLEHTIAKNIDLTVSWPFRNSTQSIKMQRIIK